MRSLIPTPAILLLVFSCPVACGGSDATTTGNPGAGGAALAGAGGAAEAGAGGAAQAGAGGAQQGGGGLGGAASDIQMPTDDVVFDVFCSCDSVHSTQKITLKNTSPSPHTISLEARQTEGPKNSLTDYQFQFDAEPFSLEPGKERTLEISRRAACNSEGPFKGVIDVTSDGKKAGSVRLSGAARLVTYTVVDPTPLKFSSSYMKKTIPVASTLGVAFSLSNFVIIPQEMSNSDGDCWLKMEGAEIDEQGQGEVRLYSGTKDGFSGTCSRSGTLILAGPLCDADMPQAKIPVTLEISQ